MLKLTDLRKTTRKASEYRIVYPHLLRDRTLNPRIELAIRYMESMLGKRRSELDQEVILRLFGDPKIARCIVASLGATYRHRARAFSEELPAEQVAALAAHGIADSMALRLWLFKRANVAPEMGFIGGAERAAFLRAAADDLGITETEGCVAIAAIERLISLDFPANAPLVRVGTLPTADDMIARFNFETLAALLANARTVTLSWRSTAKRASRKASVFGAMPTTNEIALWRAMCALAGVRAEMSSTGATLYGQQDALAGWARHGVRLVRLLSALLTTGMPARSGEAEINAPTGDIWLLRLASDMLAMLGGASEEDIGSLVAPTSLLTSWERASTFAADLATLRRAGELPGMDRWVMRRAIEPIILADGVYPALFTFTRGDERVYLVPLPASEAAAQRLAQLAARVPLITLDLANGDEAQTHIESTTTVAHLRYDGRKGASLPSLPALLDRVVGKVADTADATLLAEVFAEARTAGALTEAHLAERLGCAEDAVAARLSVPMAQAERIAQGLCYVEGFGLCTAETLERAQQAARDVAGKWEAQAQGSALMIRTLGRRLREITGASEGIECLIAYLGAA